MTKKVSWRDFRVFTCGVDGCGFEHWDGYELFEHLLQAHGFKMKAALTRVKTSKKVESGTWRLGKK